MKHKHLLAPMTILIMVVLVITGCTTAQEAPCPTAEAQACPTVEQPTCPTAEPQACPTAAAQAMPGVSSFHRLVATTANATITFDPGDKCSLRVRNPVVIDEGLTLEVVANDNAYQSYIVWVEYLDPGMTLADLNTLDKDPINPSAFVHAFGTVFVTPLSTTISTSGLNISADQGPIFFTCMTDGPGPRKIIGHLGPLEIETTP